MKFLRNTKLVAGSALIVTLLTLLGLWGFRTLTREITRAGMELVRDDYARAWRPISPIFQIPLCRGVLAENCKTARNALSPSGRIFRSNPTFAIKERFSSKDSTPILISS